MSDRMVKFRLVTYFDQQESNVLPNGDPVLVERTASHGEVITLRPQDEARLDSLGALYTAEEAKEIEAGTYRGIDAEHVYRMRAGIRPTSPIEPAEGEGFDVSGLDAEQIADYIKENKLNVDQTVGLAGDDLESIERVLDAENIATDNDPRVGVTGRLEAKMKAITQQQ